MNWLTKISDRKLSTITDSVTTTNTVTNTVEESHPFLLIGLRAGINEKLFAAVAPEIIFVTKKRKAFGASYDLINKIYNASIYLPIKF